MASGLVPPVIAELRARTSEFSAKLDEAKGKLVEFSATPTEARIKASITDLKVKIDAAKAELATLDAEGERAITLRANIAEFEGQVAKAKGSLATIHDTSAASKLASVGGKALLGLTAGFAGAAAMSLKMAGDFQSTSAHLVTDAGESAGALGQVRQGMLAIAGATGTSLTDIVNGMYHVESAGYHGAAGLRILKVAAEGAKVGGADLDTVSKTLTGTLRAYGLSAKDAVPVMNELIATTGSGDMRMQDLASSLGNVAPIAAAAGVSLAQVGGAIATMTAQNMSAQQATQDLANLIRGLQSPSQVAINEMAQMGLNANDVSKNLGHAGLTGTLGTLTEAITKHMGPAGQVILNAFNQSAGASQDMQIELSKMPPGLRKVADSFIAGKTTLKDWRLEMKALPANQQAMASGFLSTYAQAHKFNQLLTSGSPAAQTYMAALSKMTGGATGLNTALMLTGANAGEFHKSVRAIGDAAKKSSGHVENWGTIQKTFNQQLEQAKVTAETLAVKFGTVLIPPTEHLMHDIADTVTWLQKHKDVSLALAGVVGGVLATAIGTFAYGKAKAFVTSVQDMYHGVSTLLQKMGLLKSAANDAQGPVNNLGNATQTAGSKASTAATEQDTLATKERAVGGAASTSTGKVAGLSGVESTEGSTGAIAAGEESTLAGAETTVGADAAVAAPEVATLDAAEAAGGAGLLTGIGGAAAAALGPAGAIAGGMLLYHQETPVTHVDTATGRTYVNGHFSGYSRYGYGQHWSQTSKPSESQSQVVNRLDVIAELLRKHPHTSTSQDTVIHGSVYLQTTPGMAPQERLAALGGF